MIWTYVNKEGHQKYCLYRCANQYAVDDQYVS